MERHLIRKRRELATVIVSMVSNRLAQATARRRTMRVAREIAKRKVDLLARAVVKSRQSQRAKVMAIALIRKVR